MFRRLLAYHRAAHKRGNPLTAESCIEVAAWSASILLEAALVRRVRRPLFRAYLWYDLARSILIYALWLADALHAAPGSYWWRNRYAEVFALTEPLDAVLLGVAGIEAGREIGPAAIYPWALAGSAVLAGFLIPRPLAIPFASLFIFRSLITASVAGSLLATAIWTRRYTAHAAILFVFIAVDFVSYLAILMGGHGDPEMLVMCGQTACFAGWLVGTWRGIQRRLRT